jgi:single-stranded DNA-binding protein
MITEIGRLTQEVETKKLATENGDISVLNNRLAIFQGKDRTTFIDITAWGDTADFIAQHFFKGDEIYINGEIRNKSFTTDEKTIQICFIRVSNVKMIFGRNSKCEKENV